MLTDSQWEKLVSFHELVFTRTTPEQKLLIIEKFQTDIGISILDASDIAKEAADLILMNSEADQLFLSIIEALKFGRLVFENLKKTICYLLPAGSYSELWPVIMNVFFGMPQMLSSFLMIIICCLTDCVGSIVLAYESAESNLLKKKPRVVTGERLVNFKLLFHAYFCVGTFYTFTSFLVAFLNLTRRGLKFDQFALSFGSYEDIPNIDNLINMSSSIYFVNLIIMQMFNLLTLRTRHLSFFQHSILKNKK
ncbi:Potassium-transporting ATPase alpha chain 2 [Candida viswanathii]|uniref:Potassium-transporting ATPase alpha chain 2 n=1 Tax=Candida viswanathii TaxID=5486 RepID=A0A367YBL0_9ASCO|nr:Potassium-transporting ATPase alpha chain 2 [Candida viswanathii]